MQKTQFLEFITHFDMVRPGFYHVPYYVVIDCYDEVMNNGDTEMKPMFCYEIPLHILWDYGTPNQRHLDEEQIEFLQSYLAGNEYYFPTEEDHGKISEMIGASLLHQECEKSYKTRRKKANIAIKGKKLRKAVFEKDNYSCRHCGSLDRLSVDHIIPVKQGGGDEEKNLQTLCVKCNSKKGGRHE